MASRTVARKSAKFAQQVLVAMPKQRRLPVPSFIPCASAIPNVSMKSSTTSLRDIRWFSDKAEEKDEKEETTQEKESESADAEAEQDTETAAEPTKEEQMAAEIQNLKDQLLRSLAEQDNTRRIAKQDVASAKQFAIKSFAKSLLDVSDNLSRAIEAVPEDARADKEGNPVLHTLYEGIEMTETGLIKAFESNGLIKYGEVGEEFDPNKHNALFEYPDPEQTPGSIGQIIKAGFMLNDRVLRPAEVGVVKKE